MWIVRSAATYRPSEITKLLEDGFEPFAIVAAGQTKKRKPIFKMYFKKNDSFEIEPIAQTLEMPKVEYDTAPLAQVAQEFNEILDTVLQKFLNDFNKICAALTVDLQKPLSPEELAAVFPQFREKLTKSDKALTEEIPPGPSEELTEVINRSANNEEQQEEDLEEAQGEDVANRSRELTPQLAERRQYEGDGDFLSPESFGQQLERVDPKGDTFRVVDHAPVPRTQRTLEQETLITKIRELHNTNITVSPRQEDGSLIIHADDMIYTVREDGTYKKDENSASRSSV